MVSLLATSICKAPVHKSESNQLFSPIASVKVKMGADLFLLKKYKFHANVSSVFKNVVTESERTRGTSVAKFIAWGFL